MNEVLGSHIAQAAINERAAQWATRTGITFAFEKRRVDGEHALSFMEGHAKTELINALRTIGQQLHP